MCIIVDMNVAHRVFLRENDPDFAPVHESLFGTSKPKASIVYGGQLLREYAGNNAVRRVIAILDRAARARRVTDDAVDAETTSLCSAGQCVSDDEHIIALARISGVRLLCSHDRQLHRDFTSKHLIDSPRGKVYQNASHVTLIRTFCT